MEFIMSIAPWLIVASCIFGEAFFAASELSIVSSNRIRLEEEARKGPERDNPFEVLVALKPKP